MNSALQISSLLAISNYLVIARHILPLIYSNQLHWLHFITHAVVIALCSPILNHHSSPISNSCSRLWVPRTIFFECHMQSCFTHKISDVVWSTLSMYQTTNQNWLQDHWLDKSPLHSTATLFIRNEASSKLNLLRKCKIISKAELPWTWTNWSKILERIKSQGEGIHDEQTCSLDKDLRFDLCSLLVKHFILPPPCLKALLKLHPTVSFRRQTSSPHQTNLDFMVPLLWCNIGVTHYMRKILSLGVFAVELKQLFAENLGLPCEPWTGHSLKYVLELKRLALFKNTF